MAHFHTNALIGASGADTGDDAAVATKSLRFNGADSAYLTRTPSSAGNRKTWTLSFWVKLCGSSGHLISAGNDAFQFELRSDGQYLIQNSGSFNNTYSGDVFRDYSAWQHFVIEHDATNTYCKIYHNGSLNRTITASNADGAFNNNTAHNFNGRSTSLDSFTDFYLADVHFVDGTALTPTSFGAFDSDGIWQASVFSESHGTNGFHLKFGDSSSNAALGKDSSGNGNNFTANNLSAVAGVNYSGTGSGQAQSNRPYSAAFDGSLSTFCEPYDNSTVTFDFTSFTGGGISVSSSLRMYLNRAGSPAAGHFTVNGTNLGLSLPSGGWLNISGVSLLQTITFYHQSGSSSVELYAVEVDGTILVDGSAADIDLLFDVPTNGDQSDTGAGGEVSGNYAVLNPLNKHNSNNSLSNGNLEFTTSGSDGGLQESTIGMSSGKFYFEVVYSRSGQGQFAGIRKPGSRNYDNSYIYTGTANKYTNGGSGAGYGATLAHGDVIGTAFDADNGTLTFYKNGVSQGQAFSGISGTYSFFVGSFGGPPTGIVNFGARPFVHAAPSNFKALNTANLTAATIADGSTAMDAVLYTGNGTSQTISGLGFSPDWVWTKLRSAGFGHRVWDTVRGATKRLEPHAQTAEATESTALTAFTSDGFSVGSEANVNTTHLGGKFVAWCWDGGSSTVSNTDGNRTCNVRANPSAGFSIVSWNGNRSSGTTLGHGLNAAPELIIIKNRDVSTNWMVYHKATGHGGYLGLNMTAAFASASSVWSNTAPTNTVFTVGADTESNGNGSDMIAYCFTSVAGYSEIGSFVNPSSSEGAFVYCGFRPAFILGKCAVNISSSSGLGDWILKDSKRSPFNNPSDGNTLVANVSNAEDGYYSASQAAVDILSNGFKIRHPNSSPLGDPGRRYIFIAFAENPFQANGGLAR